MNGKEIKVKKERDHNKVFILSKNEFHRRVFMNFVNAGLAGALVFAGSFANGGLSKEGCIMAISAAGIVMLTKFKDFWSKEMNKKTGTNILFNFL